MFGIFLHVLTESSTNVDSHLSVTRQSRISAVRMVSTQIYHHVYMNRAIHTHIRRTERTALIRNWRVTDKCESTCILFLLIVSEPTVSVEFNSIFGFWRLQYAYQCLF
jgi:hypothetical protein